MAQTNWLDPDWRHEVTNAVIEWVVIGILAGAVVFMWMVVKQSSLFTALMVGAVVGAASGGAVWVFAHRPQAADDQTPSPQISVVLSARKAPLPSQLPAEPESLWILQLFPTPDFGGLLSQSLSRVSSQNTAGLKWDNSPSPPIGTRCELRNFSDVPIISLTLGLTITFREVERPSPGMYQSGKVRTTMKWTIEAPTVLESKTGRFAFYIQNISPDLFAAVSPDKFITVKLLGKPEQKDVALETIGDFSAWSFNPAPP